MIVKFFRNLTKTSKHINYIDLRCMCNGIQTDSAGGDIKSILVQGQKYQSDEWTNVSPRILSLMERKLHLQPQHPLGLIKQRICDFMYGHFKNPHYNSPLFSLHQNLGPVVTTKQNFDSVLVPEDHVSRKKSDSYYFNKNIMLRAHTSAHQAELISMGLDNFLVVGDVYRRDSIDSSHYPVFHQMEGVRLFQGDTFFDKVKGPKKHLKVFENGVRTDGKQELHTIDSSIMVELDLKDCLLGLTKELFGQDIEYRWVDCYFPFTHPSWELEIFWKDEWMEVLGCGVVEQELLHNCGASDKIGWAFGLGLERLAMRLYQIPDIRTFWSTDPGFLSQFKGAKPKDVIKFVEISKHPACVNDISFWLPVDYETSYSENDFYDLVRSIAGDLCETVELFDTFYHPKKKKFSHAYRITYRHMDKAMTQDEVNEIHSEITKTAIDTLNVTVR